MCCSKIGAMTLLLCLTTGVAYGDEGEAGTNGVPSHSKSDEHASAYSGSEGEWSRFGFDGGSGNGNGNGNISSGNGNGQGNGGQPGRGNGVGNGPLLPLLRNLFR